MVERLSFPNAVQCTLSTNVPNFFNTTKENLPPKPVWTET